MATLEELRQKRLQELQNLQESGGLGEAREKRIAELQSKKIPLLKNLKKYKIALIQVLQ